MLCVGSITGILTGSPPSIDDDQAAVRAEVAVVGVEGPDMVMVGEIMGESETLTLTLVVDASEMDSLIL